MKKLIGAVVLALVVIAAGVRPASAHDAEHCNSGKDFGQHHAEMAQDGMLNGEHNPGMHRGYSHCLP